MANDRELRPLSSYLEFGLRLHWEDFLQLTAGALLIYLPVSLLMTFALPSNEEVIQHIKDMKHMKDMKVDFFLFRVIVPQFLLRMLQTFVFIVLILRIDERRKSGENIWDFSDVISRFGRVALVDLAYVSGLQIMGIVVFVMALVIVSLIFGYNPFTPLFSFLIAAFLVIGPAIRYYFSSYVSLFWGTSFTESFRRAAILSTGGERLIVALVVTFLFIWFAVWQIFQGIFGGSILGQLIVQAGVMATSIPYFIASYLLFFDLVPPEEEQTSAVGNEIPGL